MDLHNILYSPNAANIQVVINADELRKCFEKMELNIMQRIREHDEPQYYTREQLAQLLHVSAPTIYKYRRKGLLPEPVTIDGRVLYDKAQVRRSIKNGNIRLKG